MNKITKAFALKAFKAGRTVYIVGRFGRLSYHVSHRPEGWTPEAFFEEKCRVAAGLMPGRLTFYT